MPAITVDELCYMLTRQDPESVTLIVEGDRDVLFMEALVPSAHRINSAVYPISSIDLPGQIEGGNKGRILTLADVIHENDQLRDRVFFLVDADNDRFVECQHLPSVMMTDYSDIECYALSDCCLGHILYTFGISADQIDSKREKVIELCKPIKALRVASHVTSSNLKINETAGRLGDRLRRYSSGRSDNLKFDAERFENAVHANSGSDAEQRALVSTERTKTLRRDLPAINFVHGKDLLGIIAQMFNVRVDEAARLVAGAVRACLETIRLEPSMAVVDRILRL